MEILDKNDIIVEIDKKVVISFNKKYKDFIDTNGNPCSLDLKEVKKEITDYLLSHRNKYEGQKVFAFVYDYDSNIAVTVMKRLPDCEIYDVIGFADMVAPEETFEDDEEKAETKAQMKILKENEKIQASRLEELTNAKN
ncbi:MAG: hypothetical protein ACI4VQ_02270 [Clostridia bacterium]